MKKRKIRNLIMVFLIVLMTLGGVLGVGLIRGWFDRESPEAPAALLCEVRGIVYLERSSVSFPVTEDTYLRRGDLVTCSPGATGKIQTQGGVLTLGEGLSLSVTEPAAADFSAFVERGEVFAQVTVPVKLSFPLGEVAPENAVFSLSVRSGAQSLSVFYGAVEGAEAGQQLQWISSSPTVTTLQLQSLNDFTIQQIRAANSQGLSLCFTNQELDQLLAERLAAQQALLKEQQEETVKLPLPTQSEEESTEASTEPPATTQQMTASAPATEQPAETEPIETATSPAESSETGTESTTPTDTELPSTETEPDPTETEPKPTEIEPQPTETEPQPTETEPEPSENEPPTTEPRPTCTLTIRCDTILNNMEDLDPGKVGFVPADGVILYPVEVEFTEGETVFDILKRVCETLNIQLEYVWTPLYDSYYVEGINYLYEFDCGSQSGWMYKVNGWFPNYGCSSYYVEDGDSIVWCYTCEGLGADVGGGM